MLDCLTTSHSRAFLCILTSVICLPGCGGSDSQPEPSAPATGSAETVSAPAPQDAAPGTPVNAALAMSDPRTDWIGDIPYDVFFDRPLDVVRDQTMVGTTPVETTGTPETGSDPPPETADPMPSPDAGTGSEIDWAELVSAELLNEAVTDIRNRLTANLQTVAAYNRTWDETALDGHTLATLAAVIEKHPDEIAWSENAKFVRDLGYEIWLNADGTGQNHFRPTQEAFESVVTILNGGPPPDIESDDIESFADVVDRGVMMQQIEKTFGWLKADVNTETRLKEDADRVAREASVMVAFGTVMLDEGYDFFDEPDYQTFVREFVDGNREMLAASPAEVSDFASFQAGRNVVQSSCGVCHQKYQGSDSDF